MIRQRINGIRVFKFPDVDTIQWYISHLKSKLENENNYAKRLIMQATIQRLERMAEEQTLCIPEYLFFIQSVANMNLAQ